MATFSLFAMGNPLLDIQVTEGEPLLEKYGLKPNDAVLANEQQLAIYDDIVKNWKVTYVAGGAAQNAARAAAYVLPEKSVMYTGCVGEDELADQLRAANAKEGVESAYQVAKGQRTGACAVVITGHHRSLCTTLQAAESFTPSHLSSPEIAPLIQNAKFFYVGGFFLTHGVESALELAKHASNAGKVYTLNLSAPFIPQFFKAQLQQVLPYVDILFGNESEAASYAEANGLPTSSVADIAQAFANLDKANPSRPRLVVITQGAESTIVASSTDQTPKVFAVQKLSAEQIVDTNGAGDMFAGGFLGAYVSGKPLEECVETGHALGAMCVQQVGPTLKFPKVKIF
ncbi:Ribokinase-like protein [Dacryopinax primogenitus]|uniref:Adenosine kinase n=1 Tax=Dacryopinax primogenitus (strain DJM 731) TaxID=1858805 RepID=M5G8N7_DACPD|nr:Ribokinase-like protein [Dacryopinax primogenitus]EJU00133.1 Ribokinase-like protein [Dacryopinax primogenitus]